MEILMRKSYMYLKVFDWWCPEIEVLTIKNRDI
jgi:hypothetical protein